MQTYYVNKVPFLKPGTPPPNMADECVDLKESIKTNCNVIPTGTLFECLLHDGCFMYMAWSGGVVNIIAQEVKVLFDEVQITPAKG
jgi:hypothetical protein